MLFLVTTLTHYYINHHLFKTKTNIIVVFADVPNSITYIIQIQKKHYYLFGAVTRGRKISKNIKNKTQEKEIK